MNTTLVINSKGGSGKTTVTTNLASCFAASGAQTTLLDYDPQLTLAPESVPGTITATLTETAVKERQTFAIQQNITALENRVNALGVAETVVQRQGQNRIAVQVPGVQDASGR